MASTGGVWKSSRFFGSHTKTAQKLTKKQVSAPLKPRKVIPVEKLVIDKPKPKPTQKIETAAVSYPTHPEPIRSRNIVSFEFGAPVILNNSKYIIDGRVGTIGRMPEELLLKDVKTKKKMYVKVSK